MSGHPVRMGEKVTPKKKGKQTERVSLFLLCFWRLRDFPGEEGTKGSPFSSHSFIERERILGVCARSPAKWEITERIHLVKSEGLVADGRIIFLFQGGYYLPTVL